MRRAVLILLVSVCVQFLCFWRWPGNPDWDVHHSIFAAQNFLAHRGLKSIDLYPEPTDDLAHLARIHWMTHWPPAHSLLYVAAMEFGLAPGPATKALAFLFILTGGLGWLYLAKRLEASPQILFAIALSYPWLAMIARSYLDYKNDHVGCALAPWVYFAVLRIEPLQSLLVEGWTNLVAAALLAGITVCVKYSLAPLIIASGLYLLWLDRFTRSRQRLARLFVFGVFLALPGLALWGLNRAWGGNKYPLTGGGLHVFPLVFAKNLIANTVGAASGWEFLVIQANGVAEKLGHHLFSGIVFLVSLVICGIWLAYLFRTRWQQNEKRFVVYLALLTVSFAGMLIFTTLASPIGYDFTSDGRFALPVSIGYVFLVALVLGKWQEPWKLRVPVALSLAIPIIFSACFYAGTGLFATPYLEFPRTEAARLFGPRSIDSAYFRILERSAFHPDLVVVPGGEFLTELEIPALYTQEVLIDKQVYGSSRDLKILAIIPRDESSMVDENFSRASVRKPLPVPEGFPYTVWELDYSASPF